MHRLSSVGGVITYAAHETSQEGFEAEWRGIAVLTVDGDMVNRCHVFDEADVDAAIARFEALKPGERRLENTASRGVDRYLERVVARDWDAIADMLAADYYTDDRRHLVGGGIHGRDAEIASVQAQASLGVTRATSTVIAVRGERLALSRLRYSGHHQGLETFVAEMLVVFEIKTGDRFLAAVAYDLDDLDAAIAELDARYLVGEAAAHGHAWRVIAQVYTTLNGGEMPATATDFVDIDHRRLAVIGSGDLKAYLTSSMADTTDSRLYVEAVHRLTDFGAVVTQVASGTSRAGFSADWRVTGLYLVEGDLVNRYEVFDESDLDAALARFEELRPAARKLDNTARRVKECAQACFASKDWAAATAMVAEDFITDDRRRVISAGIHRGRDENVANLRAASDIGFDNLTSTVIATRGERLLLDRVCFTGRDPAPEPFSTELLRVFEIDAQDRIAASIFFDLDDIDAAYEELNARYRAGEAAPYASTWSVIAALYAGFKRQELPATTRDWTYIDHRSLINVEAVDLPAFIRAGWDLTTDIGIYMEAVHRLSDLGAVVTHTAHAVSREDSDVEWRMIDIFTVDGDLISRCEMFDEADLDTALARFDELDRPK